jgi:signal transduction histidine kinase
LTETPVHYERLLQLKDKIGIDDRDLNVLGPFADLLIARKHEFADHFYNVFHQIPEARIVLENESRPGLLKKAWADWFEMLFRTRLDKDFLLYLFRIGARHVEVNLDHRFTNLGFSVIRQFCHKVLLDEAHQDEDGVLLFIFDKLLDLCLLVETDAFIENTTRCDLEVFQGVEDRVRNPALVIGGHIRRLQRQVEAGSKEYRVYETLMAENERLERMVGDIRTYMEFFSQDVRFEAVDLEGVIAAALNRLRQEHPFRDAIVAMDLSADARLILGDPKELEHLFYSLIRNAMEAADPKDPSVKVNSGREESAPRNIEVEIFNTGEAPKPEEIEKFFTPFYSTKGSGAGFGLPMAKLIVRKHYGKIRMEPVPGKGTRVTVVLPEAG